MIDFWYFIPKSGVAFIVISVAAIVVWNGYRSGLAHPYYWIMGFEFITFIVCFMIADRERHVSKR